MVRKLFYLPAIALCVAVFLASCRSSIYSTEYNLDFEYAKNDSVPTEWTVRNFLLTGYTLKLDHRQKHHGRSSVRARWSEGAMLNSWGGFQNYLPGKLVAGKELEISGWVKTEDIENICAGYGIFPYVPQKTESGFLSAIDTVGGIRGTAEWTRHTIRRVIDADATCVMIAGFVSGRGTAWFDDIELRIDGKKYEDPELQTLKSKLTPRDKRKLDKYVYPLRTCEPDGGDTRDLDLFRGLIGDCKVVGLGEYTHGTSEIYRMKDRIVRYLAENAGFDLFTIEANLPESFRLNDYTVDGKGDPKQMLRNLYVWPWRTEELLGLVEWMKTYNASTAKIEFTGWICRCARP